ncbi:phosphohistidine phosphatase [Sphingobium wenxiniae]|jgi:phosphohistidine phosphatase|uniref:Phosphohistidine phosphatase n=2 Tax=Sphingobium TaxID=165695 RepID=T0GPM2_9SPHN|nr:MULTISPECIES: histidine phosphatase family protein [Sphingobium]EQB01933.1 phosphohistidine phosphatase [Sphingobium baderi LL03]KMS62194.1 phosphohistidine phosphatase [Sphingobium baderi LL03]MBB6191692.1 phosphohistidine phosphatase [Sphingobium wenxiniae]TWH92709.1 phosphohistidine phosphatase [Sphingobium wenxiniae]WRD76471.1 histidine phosphatase family protein [Sphingobium baderi]
MKRLTLLRHAKSDWDDPVARDFDRPLNRRGEKAALLMGRFAQAEKMRFDWLVASPAVRVVQTLDAFLSGYGEGPDAHWDRRIYLASAATLLDVVRDLPDEADHALMSGHNPGFEELILELVPEAGDNPLREDLEVKFPTASIAVIDLPIGRWADARENIGTLISFTRPRDLDPALGPGTH